MKFVIGFGPGLPTANSSPPDMLCERAAVGEALAMDNPLSIGFVEKVGGKREDSYSIQGICGIRTA
jgi:hypothetical protein